MYPSKPNDDRLAQDVLGHLLGALDDAEQAVVELRMEDDPDYGRELMRWRRHLASLEALRHDYEPPEGLRSRTCQLVDERRTAVSRWIGMSPIPCPPSWIGRVGLLDVSVVVLLFVAAAVLLLPAICNSRFHAQMVWCQDGLRQSGAAMTDCSQRGGGPSSARFGGGVAVVPVGVAIAGQQENSLLFFDNAFQILRPVSTNIAQGTPPVRTIQTLTLPVSSVQENWLSSRRVAYVSNPSWGDASDTPVAWGDSIVEKAEFPAGTTWTALPGSIMEPPNARTKAGGWNLLFDDGHAGFFVCSSERDLVAAMSSEPADMPVARVFTPSMSKRR